MKKILLLTAAVLISGSAMAQHEHFHVFRNDKLSVNVVFPAST